MVGELFDVGGHLGAEALVIAGGDGHADDGEALGEESEAAEVEKGGDEFAFGEVAGGAEDDKDAGRAGAAVVGQGGGVFRHKVRACWLAGRGSMRKARVALCKGRA
jgi:hypothetical protein